MGISAAEKSHITTSGKKLRDFSAADPSLALFSAMNEWQLVLFLKRE